MQLPSTPIPALLMDLRLAVAASVTGTSPDAINLAQQNLIARLIGNHRDDLGVSTRAHGAAIGAMTRLFVHRAMADESERAMTRMFDAVADVFGATPDCRDIVALTADVVGSTGRLVRDPSPQNEERCRADRKELLDHLDKSGPGLVAALCLAATLFAQADIDERDAEHGVQRAEQKIKSLALSLDPTRGTEGTGR